MVKTKIIATFPGLGRRTLLKNSKNKDIIYIGLGEYRYVIDKNNGAKLINPEFPKNYINKIKENIGIHRVIIIDASYAEVRKELERQFILYELYVPTIDRKDELINNMKSSGKDAKIIYNTEKYFEKNIRDYTKDEKFAEIVWLESGKYLSDVIE